MKRRHLFVLIIAFVLGCVSSSHAQEKAFLQRTEFDVSISPLTNTTLRQGSVLGADLAARYQFSNSFSAGIGINPTFFEYYDGEINYVPLYLSFRYSVLNSGTLSPYFLLNLGGSFSQIGPDPEFQGRFAIGTGYSISQRCSLFVECGLTYMSTGCLWVPISLGVRL